MAVAAAVVVVAILAYALASRSADTARPAATDSSVATATRPSAPAETLSAPPAGTASADAGTPAPTPDGASAAPSPAPSAAPTGTVPIDSSADVVTGVTMHVSSIEAVQGEAVQPGEVGGPALRVTIDVVNTTGASVSLANAVVNAYYGASWTPAVTLAKPGGSPFPADVAAGATASGTFLFSVPEAARSLVRIEVDAQLGGPVVVFEGSTPS